MPRSVAAVLACIAGITGLALASGVAAANPSQTDVTPTCPSDPTDYPPATDGSSTEVVVTGGSFTPGGSGSLSLAGTIANHTYSGTIHSTPIPFGPADSDANGDVAFAFAVPADFELGEAHSVTLDCDGVLAASFEVCVNEVGSLASLESCADGSISGVVDPTSTTIGSGGATPRSGVGAAAAGGGLARTGLDKVLLLLRIALVLIACGALVVYVQRRRTTPQRL